jgi:trimethylamine--corrinoid protein Co-methyltransferase
LTALLAGLAGSNVIYGAGMLECGMTVDYGQLLLDSDMLQMVLFLLRGEEVTEENLDLEEIHQIGPHGNYMMSKLTRKLMRSQSRPKFFDRMNMESWKKQGSPDCYQVALNKAKDLLQNHMVEPLSASVADDVRRFVVEAEKELGVPSKTPDFDPTKGSLV